MWTSLRVKLSSRTHPRASRLCASACFIALAMLVLPYRPTIAEPFVYVGQRNNQINVIDAATNQQIDTIILEPFGTIPKDLVITPNGKQIYVADSTRDRIVIVDTETNQQTGSIDLGGTSVRKLALAPNGGRVYVTTALDNEVVVIDIIAEEIIDRINVNAFSQQIAVSPDGQRGYVTTEDGEDGEDGNVVVLDLRINAVIESVGVGDGPEALAVTPNGKHIYVVNTDSDSVSVIDTTLNQVVQTIAVGNEPDGIAIAPDGSHVYVASFVSASQGRIDIIDTKTNQVSGNIFLEERNDPGEIAISPDGSRLYVTFPSDHVVSVIATATNQAVETINIGTPTSVVVITPEAGSGYRTYVVRDNRGPVIDVIDSASRRLVNSITVDNSNLFSPRLAITPDGNRLYTGGKGAGDRIWVVDVISNVGVPIALFSFGDIMDVAVTPDGSEVYVIHQFGAISVIDTATNTIVYDINTSTECGVVNTRSITFTPDGQRAYVGTVDDLVCVIDTSTRSGVDTIIVDGQFVAVSPDGKRVYASDGSREIDNEISVIDTSTNTIVDTIPTFSVAAPGLVTFSPNGTRGYAPIGLSGISVIDTVLNEVIINVGDPRQRPDALSVTPDGILLFTSHEPPGDSLSSVSVFDLSVLVDFIPDSAGPRDSTFGIVTSPLPIFGLEVGNINRDDRIDRQDLDLLLADLNKTAGESACGLRCDLDGDGRITVVDARLVVLRCSSPRCR